MTVLANPTLRVVLYEGEGSRPLPKRATLLRALLERGLSVSCSRAGGGLSAVEQGVMLVLGRFTESIPETSSDDSGQITVHFRNVEGLDQEAMLALVDETRAGAEIPEPGSWKPWFPVIDYDRCTNCMQCLSFCLFDVYGVDAEEQIQVQNQSNCKTDCPACSRVCPDVAILFPKYREGPINGAEINEADVQREAMKVDISALLGGDIYSALRERSAKAKSRFSKERDEERALKERQKCLVKLQKQLDIPIEVLGSLPSMDQIMAKAEAARERAQALIDKQEGSKENPDTGTGP